MKNITTVILAAGRSTRFISSKSKLTHDLAGLPIVSHVYNIAQKISGKSVVVVCNKNNYAELKSLLSGCKLVIKKFQNLNKILNFVSIQRECYFSRMTGSGSVCYGIFKTEKSAKLAHKRIKKKFPKYWTVVAKTI